MKGSTYYCLFDEQSKYLRHVVAGKVVADLGCGDGTLSRAMVGMGALHVHAVDKAPFKIPGASKSTSHQTYFQDWVAAPHGIEVAVVCWPQNNSLPGLVEILRGIQHVVYVGKNTDGSACGHPGLHTYLAGRESLRCIPYPRNVLIHYGPEPRTDKSLHHEEFAAIDPYGVRFFHSNEEQREPSSWLTKENPA